MLQELQFTSLIFNSRKQVLTGVDTTGDFLIKIEIDKNKNKQNNISQEYEILNSLNKKGCKTCATVYEHGQVNTEFIESLVSEEDMQIVVRSNKQLFGYIIQEFLPHSDDYNFADVVLSVLEQKNLGFYQGDIKPDNIRFNPEDGICYIIDYDQAIVLGDEIQNFDNKSFFNFCDDQDRKRYGFGNWLRHFPKVTKDKFKDLFTNDSFDLSKTTIFNRQVTTNTVNGIYHTISERDIFIDGSRTVEVRSVALDNLEFQDNETVLDVGCNSGLLSMYLHGRGCKVTGSDIDKYIVSACSIISNILRKDIQFECYDLDCVDEIPRYDTVMLFSVLHHTKDPVSNAKKIAKSCSRVIIETRMMERGKQPINGKWVDTSAWLFEDVNKLTNFLTDIFDGFVLNKNVGNVDKNRFIFELVKK